MAKIVLFGKLADLAGKREFSLSLPVGVRRLPALAAYLAVDNVPLAAALAAPSLRFVVNGAVCGDDVVITDSDEIAFLPPVSGG